ncbi:MAG: hypothetical protein Q8T13_00275 [Acidobacteriota bacterium]|nr:hypothetical protein [Acidobacteriota bacterium]
MSRTAEWCCALFAFLVLNLAYAGSQPLNTFLDSNAHEEPGVDGQVYHAMAQGMPRDLPPQGVAPFVYRLGTPLLAATLAKSQDWVISAGFDRLNVAFNALSVALLLLLLQRHVTSVAVRLLVVIAFMVEPHSPVRLSYFQPLSVEPAMLAGLLAGLLGIEWFQSRPGPGRAAVVALIVGAGVVFHEAVLIVGVCMLFVSTPTPPDDPRHSSWRDRLHFLDRTGAWLPLISGGAMLAAIHAWVAATPSDYSASGELLRWLRDKSIVQYVVAWFLVFGPLLAVPIYFWRRSLGWLWQQPALLAYVSMFAVLAWVGGGDTERFLVLASPVVYLVIGRAMTLAAIRPAAVATASLVLVQALSSRVFSPIGGPVAPPQIGAEIWERLGWAGAAWALSYENLWSQFCAPSMMGAYLLWYGLTAAGVLAFLRYGNSETTRAWPANAVASTWASARRRVIGNEQGWATSLLIALATLVALSPVVWLSLSRFYWNHYDQQGYGYVVYNLSRLWTLALLLVVFWTTGSRILAARPTSARLPEHWTDRFFDQAVCGAAAWAVGVALLATLRLYYLWVILPLVGIALFLAASQFVADRRAARPATASAEPHERWGVVGLLLRLTIGVFAAGLLLTIALWGNVGPDNDVPGNYLPYYEAVLRAHSNGPNDYWVHYFVSKGHGLAFLFNILSDVQGAALASWLVLMLGAGMIWRLATRYASGGQAIGLVGAAIYLLFFAEQGAYAKGHIVRNILILYLILSFARSLYFQVVDTRSHALCRIVVTAAVILLSPLAIVLVLPIFVIEGMLHALTGRIAEARRSLIYPAWALTATTLVCAYNYFEVGVPELHNMPSAVGRLVDFERLSQWLDPRLAFVDYRLGFLQLVVSANDVVVASPVTLPEVLPLMQILGGVLNQSTGIWLGGAAVIGACAFAARRGFGAPRGKTLETGPAWAAFYLAASLMMVTVLRLFGGGAGSSMARFTDFTTPLGIALGAVILTAAWSLTMSRLSRRVLAASISVVACVALYYGSTPMWAQLWRPSVGFFLGQNTYAAMYDQNWDTVAARRVAVAIPAHEKVELLNFLPGFTAVPATPFQRPDGGAYIKNYTTILYGTEEQAAATYRAAGIHYFLFDVAASDVMFSGFAPLFAPDSIRSRMRLVRHEATGRRDLYLLTWKGDQTSAPDEQFESFLQQWGNKLAIERKTGTYHWAYDEGARRIGGGR